MFSRRDLYPRTCIISDLYIICNKLISNDTKAINFFPQIKSDMKIGTFLPKTIVTRCYSSGCCFLGSSGATPTAVATPELFPTLCDHALSLLIPLFVSSDDHTESWTSDKINTHRVADTCVCTWGSIFYKTK